MKRLALILVTVLLLAGCASKVTNPMPNTSQEKPPVLVPTITADGKNIPFAYGTYSWYVKSNGQVVQGINADYASPYEIAKGISSSLVSSGSKILINFSRKPNELNAKEWVDTNPVKQNMHDTNSMILPNEKGVYVYEITSKWDDGDETGTATYIIKVEVR